MLLEDRHRRDVLDGLDHAPRHAPDRARVGAQVLDPLLGAPQARRRDHLHRARDLLDVLDRRDAVLDVLLRSHRGYAVAPASSRSSSAATRRPSSSSLVVGAVLGGRAALLLALLLVLDAIRLALLERVALLVEVGPEVVDRLGDRRAELLLGRVVPVAAGDLLEQLLLLRVQPLEQLLEEVLDALGLDPVEVAAGAGVDRRHLVLDPPRLELVLVQQLDQPLAARQRGLRLRVELRAELRERLELAELRQLEPQLAGHLLHRLRLGVPAHARHRDADVDRRADARAEQVALEEDLAVGDRDDVRRDVGRHVGRLRLDDRQRRQRAAVEVVVQLHGALEQARVEVEDVAGIRLAARRAAQQQRHLAVRVRVLRQVVVDAERVLAVVEEVLTHRAAGVRRHELDRRGLVGRRRDDDRLLERVVLAQRLGDLHHGGHALPDRDVDADQVLVLVVDDRVERDRRLAGLAVADDQLALAAADRDHRVDRLDAGLHRLLDRLALDDAGSLELSRARLVGLHVALAVERVAERVDDPAEQFVADGDLEQATGALDRVALLDLVPLAEEDGADVVGLEVQRQAGHVVRQLEHLERHAVVEAVHARDAVADREDGPDLRQVRPAVFHALDPLLEDAGDLVWLDLH